MLSLCILTPVRVAHAAQNTAFEEGTEMIVNPDCGFYKAFAGHLRANDESSPVDLDKMASFAGQYGLFHLRIGLEDFSANAGAKNREIDALALKGLKSALDCLRSLKMSAIIRFSYNVNGDTDSSGKYLESEPSITWIVKHVKSLGAVISDYSDVILGVESGMVGPWGEQHSTVMGSHKKSNSGTYHKIVQAWLESTPEDMGITVRRPLYFTYWINNQHSLNLSVDDLENFDCSGYQNAARVGVYNDGYLGSSTDLGTFTNREAEVAFIGRQAQNTYYGGEVVADRDTGSIGDYNCVDYLEYEGFLTHTSYLNIDWNYEYVISKWKSSTYKGSDLTYKNKTTQFVFVNNRLGYRHLITDITAPDKCRAGSELSLYITVKNLGFARMLKKPVATVIVKTAVKTQTVACELDLTTVNSRESQIFIVKFNLDEKHKGDGEIYLNLQTVYGRTIYLANSSALEFNEQYSAYKLSEVYIEKSAANQDYYLVTFDANHGSVVSGNTSQVIKAGSGAVAPVVERKGYKFVGWSCDFSNVTQNLEVVAVWEKVEIALPDDGENGEIDSSNNGESSDLQNSSSSISSLEQGSSESVSTTKKDGDGCSLSVQTGTVLLLALALIILLKIRKSAV